MPLRMELLDGSGTVVAATGEVYDTIDATLPELQFVDYPLLAGVDRYGRTMFNRTQLAPLEIELRRLLPDVPSGATALLETLISLCQAGMTMSGAELWVLGD